MAGVGFFNTGWGDAHAREAEDDFHRAFDHITIFQIHKIGFGAFRGCALFGFKGDGEAEQADDDEGEEVFHGWAFLFTSYFDCIYTLIVLKWVGLYEWPVVFFGGGFVPRSQMP